MNEITQSGASAAEETSAATEQMAGLAQELQQMVAQFKVEAEHSAANNGGHGKNNGNGHASNTDAAKARLAVVKT